MLTCSTTGHSEDTAIPDPCTPSDYKKKIQYKDKNFYHVKGTGDYEKCQETVKPLLNLSVPCMKTPCSFNGVFQPPIYSKQTELYGFSEFYYTMEDTLNMGGKYDYMKFRKAAKVSVEDLLIMVYASHRPSLESLLPKYMYLHVLFDRI